MSCTPAPIDATQTPEWAALAAHQKEMADGFTLKEEFAKDAQRVEKFSFDMDDLHFDLSKNLIDQKTVEQGLTDAKTRADAILVE